MFRFDGIVLWLQYLNINLKMSSKIPFYWTLTSWIVPLNYVELIAKWVCLSNEKSS